MVGSTNFSRDVLRIDARAEIDRIVAALRPMVRDRLRRRGAVVGVSGGIDSSVVASLCVRAFGKERVFCLLMPERDSSEETRTLGKMLVEHLGTPFALEDIGPILEGAGCYRRRDEFIRSVFPEYQAGWKCKIVLPSVVDSDAYRIFSVVVQSPDGRELRSRLPLQAYLGVVASTNFKQRTRKMLEYYHADRLNYAVAGTPNLLEYDQGFFVKNGDGSADFKPIAHLYKTQVYQLAEELGIPGEIRSRPPTTDTYSLPQSQEEFYFSLPYDEMDLCLFGKNQGVPAVEVGRALGRSPEQIDRVFRDIEAKRAFAEYLHLAPLTVPQR